MPRSPDDHNVFETASKRRREVEAREDQEENVRSMANVAQELAGQHGHRYGTINIEGEPKVWMGDTVNHYHLGGSTQAGKYEIFLASLKFKRMDSRLRNVAAALPTTCGWLICHEQFGTWTDNSKIHEHHGFPWIKGKPGSGKSTIMKETLAWAEKAWRSQIIVSYFFNARSPHALEKSSLGMYRSLLYQLLCAVPDSHDLFEKRFALKEKNGEVEDWTERELQNFLIELITTLRLPLLNIFVDALDEGGDDDIREMVKFLERLTAHATTAAQQLQDQKQHSQDIEVYVRSELRIGDRPQMNDLRRQIHDRSAGVFLWVVLVVAMLNKAYDRGKRSSVAMLRKLEKILPDLYDVFTQLLWQETEDLDECKTLLKWVLFSMRPLRPIELYRALQHTCLDTDTDDDDINPISETVTAYLLHCSRGLVELTKAEPFVVQFIHETVRDYLLNRNLLGQRRLDACTSDQQVPYFEADRCHMQIAEDCLGYLLNVCKDTASNRDRVKHNLLAQYAANYWWLHVRMSKIPCSLEFLESAWRLLSCGNSNLLTWVQLYNVDTPFMGLDTSLVRKDLAPPLYYAASIGITDLVSFVLLRGVDVNTQGGVYDNPLVAASARGYEKIVQILVDAGADLESRDKEYGQTPLSWAAANGHGAMVKALVEAGADMESRDKIYHRTPLLWAAACGRKDKVSLLAGIGAQFESMGEEFGQALVLRATDNGYEAVVKLLVEVGADLESRDHYGWTPLWWAVRCGGEAMIKLLVEMGADIESRDKYGRTLLWWAARNGDEGLVKLLVENGADLESRDNYDRIPLSFAAQNELDVLVDRVVE